MKAVWKFRLHPDEDLWMHEGAQVLSVGAQPLQDADYMGLFVWALVDPEAPMVRRGFAIAPTGPEQDDEIVSRLQFVGSIQNFYADGEQYVFHVFVVPEGETLR